MGLLNCRICFGLLLFFFHPQGFTYSADSYVIADAKTGTILASKNANKKRQPASTTKLVTAMVVLDRLTLNQWLSVSRNATRKPRSKAYLKYQHKYRVKDLLKALLVHSANDAATVLAEAVSGSESKFSRLMTKKAKACGATNTRFRSASGLTKKGQYTTAKDLFKIMQCAQKYARIKEYARIKNTIIRSNRGTKHRIKNHNKLFTASTYYSIGKTGYTRAAKYTYVSYIKKNGQETIISMLGSKHLWRDAKALAKDSIKLAKQFALLPKNISIRTTQKKLKLKGFYHGKVDGVMGRKTRQAIKIFQRKNGLIADGIVGTRTIRYLMLSS